ncbi:MAG TPA: type I-E CRISPR-associated protein Cse1/CasA [Aeromonadales bacterium]|nr:type I-E CRISPR-associated protein Cse1/CasA [Aeromonadales bacterium]
MIYNLISDQWITVRDFNGRLNKIKPQQLADAQWETLDAPRADLKGALFQFMIGLLQTTFAPEDREEWEELWDTPPAEEELAEAFKRYHHAFFLNDKTKPAFMQDFDLPEGEQKPVSALLLEAPGEKTLKDNQDHFIKRGMVKRMSPYWAALSLFTLQINAPSGGAGHRVGIRGGGPMTTLLIPPLKSDTRTLWHRLWLNILTKEELLLMSGNPDLPDDKAVFPWLAETRTSEKKGSELLPEHTHPLQMYWAMPRRIRLQWDEGQKGACDISGEELAQCSVTHFITKNYGANYGGYWIHPLSAYDVAPDKIPNSVKAQPGGLYYRHWMGLVMEDTKKYRQPALIVRSYKEWRAESIDSTDEAQLWVFGFDMDNMKARCWYESTMPVFSLSDEQISELGYQLPRLIDAATDSLKILKKHLKDAWFKRPKDIKGDISFIDHSFWEQTEIDFYQQLRQLIKSLDDDKAVKTILAQWRQMLQTKTTSLFDDYVLSTLNEDGDMKRIIKARKNLQKWLNTSKPMKELKAA